VPNLLQGATRRQLLEYRAAFNVDGILLVDADRETVAQVEFDLFSREAPQFAVSQSATAPDGVLLGDAKRDRPAS
jgi:hypothetical protein